MSSPYDAVVIGAGPAGSVAALTMARRGLSVLLCDRAHFPRSKPCGEGLLPGGVQILEELGLLPEVIRAGGCPFESIRFHFPDRGTAELPMNPREHPFDRPTRGIAISRETFDNLLLEAAREAGADVRTGFGVVNLEQDSEGVSVTGSAVREEDAATDSARREVVRARFAVVATGGAVPSGAGVMARTSERSARIGLSTHIPDLHPAPRVDVYIRDGYEVYTSPVDGGRRVVAIACDRARMEALGRVSPAEAHRRLLEVADLPSWLCGPPAERVTGRDLGDNRYRAIELGAGRILRVGDAAFRTDPVSAQGMMLAMLTGRAAGVRIHGALAGDCAAERVVARYRRDVHAAMRRSGDIAGSLLYLTRHPKIGRPLIAWTGSAPRHGVMGMLRRQLVAHGVGLALPLPFEPLTRRVHRQEIMDRIEPDRIPGSTWRFLELVNARFGGFRATMRALERDLSHLLRRSTLVIADVGAGDGAFAAHLSETLAARGVTTRAICIEPRLPSVHVARSGMHYVIGDGRRLPLRRGAVDLVHLSLVLHHLPDEGAERVLQEAAAAARGGILVNDLVRSYSAWVGVKAITTLLGDAVARVDGPLSIRRSFRPSEIEDLAKRAGLRGATLRRHIFFRFTLAARSTAP